MIIEFGRRRRGDVRLGSICWTRSVCDLGGIRTEEEEEKEEEKLTKVGRFYQMG